MNSPSVKFNGSDILIVDDTPVNLRALAHILTGEGYKVRKALNGQMALTACQTTVPDLILLDILMPDIDGYEVCSRLKANERTREIPVIFLSALDDPSDKVKAFNAGGTDYISKPFQVEEILARVATQLRVQHLKRQLAEREAHVEKLNAQIERSRGNLEKFAYMASEEPHSPLQAIADRARALIGNSESRLDADDKACISQILAAGEKMKQLIEELLAYPLSDAIAPPFETIECTEVLKAALDNLREEISASGAQIAHSELPTVTGDRAQLIQLFQILIGNAIRLRRPDVFPAITISVEAIDDGKWLFAIRDNDTGIAPQERDRFFKALPPLHANRRSTNNGLNLAVCQQIVERHGGQIGRDSQLSEGSTFYFTLPFLT